MTPGPVPPEGRRVAVALAAVALLLAAVAPPVGSAGAASLPADDGDATLSVDVERDGSTIYYQATVNAPGEADRVRVDGAFGVLNVAAREGFVAAGDGYRLADGRETATLTVSVDLDDHRNTPLGRIGPDGPFQAGENWAFAPSPRLHVRWWDDGSVEHARLRGAQQGSDAGAVTADTPVAVGERFVFLGPHRVETRTVDGQSVRLVVPDAASFAVGTERSFTLANRTARAAGTTPARPVTAFVLPESVRAGGGASGTDLWVRADAGGRTVAHEFAHAALRIRTTAETRWLSEAAAEYLAYRVTEEAVTATLRQRVTDADAVLTNRDSWADSSVAYRKGAALLALLDERIRTESDGGASLTAVLVRLSATDGRIDTTTLENTVAAVADERTATWFETQASGTAPATRPSNQAGLSIPVDGGLGVPASPGNALGLLAALGALSVLVWVPLRLCYGLVSAT